MAGQLALMEAGAQQVMVHKAMVAELCDVPMKKEGDHSFHIPQGAGTANCLTCWSTPEVKAYAK